MRDLWTFVCVTWAVVGFGFNSFLLFSRIAERQVTVGEAAVVIMATGYWLAGMVMFAIFMAISKPIPPAARREDHGSEG